MRFWGGAAVCVCQQRVCFPAGAVLGVEIAKGRSCWGGGGSSFPGLIGPGVPGVTAAGRQQLCSHSGEGDVWQISYVITSGGVSVFLCLFLSALTNLLFKSAP